MANVTKLTHLEHIEDVMLAPKAEGGGVDGCHTAVAWMRQLLKMLGEASASGGFLQTKWAVSYTHLTLPTIYSV